MRRDDRDLFAGLRPAGSPPGLERRALAGALEGRAPRARRLEDRLWNSRGARLGWLAACVALLAFNLLLPGPGRTVHGPRRVVEGASAAPPVGSEQQTGRPGSPRWSDQRTLLCRLLGDCDSSARAPAHGTPRRPTNGAPRQGGKA